VTKLNVLHNYVYKNDMQLSRIIDWAECNIPLDTQQVISETSLSWQSIAPVVTNSKQPRKIHKD